VCRSKHVELLINIGIINSSKQLHLVGYFYIIYTMMHRSTNVKFIWSCWYVSFQVVKDVHFRTLFVSDIALHHHVHCPTFQNPHLRGSMVHFRIHMQDRKRTVFRDLHELPAPTEHTEQHGITHRTVPQRRKGLIRSRNNNPWNHCQTLQHMQHSCNTRVRY